MKPPERSAANQCGILFATFGAAALMIGPSPSWFDENHALRAGLGGVVGGMIGVVVGLIIDYFGKRSDQSTMPTSARVRVRPTSRD